MADEPRLTKKERREAAREERRLEEARQAKEARKQSIKTGVITVAVLGAIGAATFIAITGNKAEGDVQINLAAATAAEETAGCEVLDDPVYDSREHLEPATAPPADVLYPNFRPTHSGPHYSTTFPVQADGLSRQGDERSLTHNLEHGAIIAWYDPDRIDGGTLDDWAESRNDAGFLSQRSGGAIFSSPYTDPGIDDGKAIALRAWGVAMNCDAWDQDVADAFVINNYGTHGVAPERSITPYPEAALSFADAEVTDNTEAPDDFENPEDGSADSDADVEDMQPDPDTEASDLEAPAEGETTDEG